jgi:hypothetical protein
MPSNSTPMFSIWTQRSSQELAGPLHAADHLDPGDRLAGRHREAGGLTAQVAKPSFQSITAYQPR